MTYFNLFSNILITRGVNRILISDLQRDTSELYPLEFHDIIEELKTCSIEELFNQYDTESGEVLQEYLDVLLENEYGFITEKERDKNFPPLSYEYHDYNIISDIFIELDNLSSLYKIQSSINHLTVKHLTIYSRKQLSLDEFLDIETMFKNSPLENIEIYSPFHSEISNVLIAELNKHTSRIYNLVFYNCSNIPFKGGKFGFTIHFTKETLKISSCGKVDLKYFNTNLPKVLEAINHNSCLHKKIGIDIEGNIKNCPLMEESFGNIKYNSLEESVIRSGFKKYWNLTKDHIEVCKDCEFRYICTDCRAYTERTHFEKELDISKPLKCGYDPYTCQWEEWAKNPLKQKAAQYYNYKDRTDRRFLV
ncbi:grasp-with-spasm system SPASM domain peptide maturase [Chryseobacterium flavum]|uniref:grasp-with-spasm system SPASM domain peptide maturase n=1 Tax=Chryseobacterium flavum TaxID=415851 RepID=UPI0028A6DEE1|nr:grasp-with-spasm system SPASM domain peptide maturase [Chryseobacterium flavum]